jgi:hypothetical protein
MTITRDKDTTRYATWVVWRQENGNILSSCVSLNVLGCANRSITAAWTPRARLLSKFPKGSGHPVNNCSPGLVLILSIVTWPVL